MIDCFGVSDMFFFFFDDDSLIVKQCLQQYIEDNIKAKSYCNFADLFSDSITKKDMTQIVEKLSSDVRKLYKRKYPDKMEDLKILSEVFDNNRIYNFEETAFSREGSKLFPESA